MSDVFISYSRQDQNFVAQLREALLALAQDVWIDWEKIPPSQSWWSEIQKGIARANNFVVVLSPNSMASPICQMEIEYARQLQKRIIPVLRMSFDREDCLANISKRLAARDQEATRIIWDARQPHDVFDANIDVLQQINYFFFKTDADFQTRFDDLFTVIRTDFAHKEQHTTLQLRAAEWERRGHDASFLLLDKELDQALDWLNNAKEKSPPPTQNHIAYIEASMKRTRQLHNIRRASVLGGIVAVVTTVFTIFAVLIGTNAVNETQAKLITATFHLGAAQAEVATATRQVATAIALQLTTQGQADLANAELTAVRPTLTQIAQLVQEGESRIRSLDLASRANDWLNRASPNAETAALLAIRAISDETHTPQAEAVLREALSELFTTHRWIEHMGPVLDVALSPDGRYALTGSSDGTARLWDVNSMESVHTLAGHTGKVTSVAFSQDGRYVITGSADGTAQLWNVNGGERAHTFTGHTGAIISVAISRNGHYILTRSVDDTARLWDVDSGESIHSLELGHTATSVAFSPDGRYILAGGYDGTAQLWDVDSGVLVHILRDPNGWTMTWGSVISHGTVAFSPDSRYALTSSIPDILYLWDVESASLIQRLVGHRAEIESVAFSPDGRYVLTGSVDRTAQLWDVNSGSRVYIFTGHSDTVTSVAFSPDGRYVLTGSRDHTARLWNVDNGESVRTLTGHTGTINSVAISRNGRYVITGSDDGTARLWDMDTSARIRTFRNTISEGASAVFLLMASQSVAFSPNGHYALTGSNDGTVRLREVDSGETIHILTGHTGEVWNVAFSPNGHYILTGSDDGTARLWDVDSGQNTHILEGHKGILTSLAFSPDGRYVLTSSTDNNPRLWNASSGKLVYSLIGHIASVRSVAFSPDGHYALTGSDDGTARLWDVISGESVHTLKGHTDGVWNVTFSHDGRYILTGSDDGTARLWEVESGQSVHIFQSSIDEATNNNEVHKLVRDVAFSPDGRYVLTGTRLWDVASGENTRNLEGHTADIWSVAFSPNGHYILTGSNDGTARLWDADSGTLVETLETRGVMSLAFSPDGRYALTGSYDYTVRMWLVLTDNDDLIEYACARLFRDFTSLERQQYLIPNDLPTCPALAEFAGESVWTPIASPTSSITPTFTPTRTLARTLTPTATSLPIQAASLGVNIGELPLAGGHRWSYTGRAGETLTISVQANLPANDAQDRTGLLDTPLVVRAPDGHILGEADDIETGIITDSLIENLTLAEDGVFEIEVRSWDNQGGGRYTLIIERAEETPTLDRSPTHIAPSTRGGTATATPTQS